LKTINMDEIFRIRGVGFTRKDLLALDPDILRALIHERTHHTIEVIFSAVIQEERRPPANFGSQVRILLAIWKERNLPQADSDIRWAETYLDLAKAVNRGDTPHLHTNPPTPFNEDELKVVEKLMFARRSIRQWNRRKVPEWMLQRIVEAGVRAPNACNLQCQRFLVLDDEESMLIIKGDVSLPPVKIVICQDMRIYEWMGFPKANPQNIYFDAAAAADHMLLMAHALGLGGVWLTHSKHQAEQLRQHLGLPPYLRMDTHIAVGWSAEAPLRSARIPLDYALVKLRNAKS
jgi:nitroreductase